MTTKNKIIIALSSLGSLLLSAPTYAYDFSGTYIGHGKGITKLEIKGNVVHADGKCSPTRCDWTGDKVSLLQAGTTMVVELEPLSYEKNQTTLYTTLVLTPTAQANKIQVVLVSYRKSTQASAAGYSPSSSITEILTKVTSR